MFVAFAHAFSRALHFHSALILRASSPFDGIWSSKKSNESGTQKRPSRLASLTETTTTTVLYRKRCLSFKPIHCDYSCSPTFPRVALKVLVQKELCCMYGVVVLLNKPFYIVIVAVVCFVIAVAKLSDSILNLRRISFQFGQFANFKALFPAVPKNLLRLSAFIGAIIILKFKSF